MMSTITRRIALVLMAAAFLVVNQPCAFACSCLPPGPPGDELARSAAVFAGKVVGLDVPAGVNSGADPVRVTFQISQVWKGTASPNLVVTTAQSSASCGVAFEQGQDYLVYAAGTDDALTASLCSRTGTLSAASEDLAALGPGKLPAGTPPMRSTPAPSDLPVVGTDGVAGHAAVYLLVGIALGGMGLRLRFVATRSIGRRSVRLTR